MKEIVQFTGIAGLAFFFSFSALVAEAAAPAEKRVPPKKVFAPAKKVIAKSSKAGLGSAGKTAAKKTAKKVLVKPQASAKRAAKAAPTVYRLASPVVAQFSVGETLRGEPFTATGMTEQVSGGDIVFNPSAPEKTTMSPISVDAKTFKTDSGSRDFMIRKFILKAEDAGNQYIVFSPKKISGFPETIKDSESVRFAIQGDLRIAGVTKPASFVGSVKISKAGIMGTASTTVKRSDYRLIIPEVPFVASVDDAVKLSISLTAK